MEQAKHDIQEQEQSSQQQVMPKQQVEQQPQPAAQTEQQSQAASQAQSKYKSQEAIFYDPYFHRKRKKGKWEVVDAPTMPNVPLADTHAHIHMLVDPSLALARAGMYCVGFIELMCDPSEDGTVAFDNLETWKREAGITMHHMFSRRC